MSPEPVMSTFKGPDPFLKLNVVSTPVVGLPRQSNLTVCGFDSKVTSLSKSKSREERIELPLKPIVTR